MSDEVTFEITIPTDEDGFVLLKCPMCGDLFKLIPSDYRDDSVFAIYFPGCGLSGDSYIAEDVLGLGMNMGENYVNELLKPEPKGKILSNRIKLLAPMISIANGIPVLADNIQKIIEFVTPMLPS